MMMEIAMGNLPKGYKQTEVGVIPEDWCNQTFGENCVIITQRHRGRATSNITWEKLCEVEALTFLKQSPDPRHGETIPDKVAFVDETKS